MVSTVGGRSGSAPSPFHSGVPCQLTRFLRCIDFPSFRPPLNTPPFTHFPVHHSCTRRNKPSSCLTEPTNHANRFSNSLRTDELGVGSRERAGDFGMAFLRSTAPRDPNRSPPKMRVSTLFSLPAIQVHPTTRHLLSIAARIERHRLSQSTYVNVVADKLLAKIRFISFSQPVIVPSLLASLITLHAILIRGISPLGRKKSFLQVSLIIGMLETLGSVFRVSTSPSPFWDFYLLHHSQAGRGPGLDTFRARVV